MHSLVDQPNELTFVMGATNNNDYTLNTLSPPDLQ